MATLIIERRTRLACSLLLGLLALIATARANDCGTLETAAYPSPNKGAVVIIQSLNPPPDTDSPVRRPVVVSLIDCHTLKCVFAFTTLERRTFADWNASGTRVLIVNSPDNANAYFDLLSKVGDRWNKTSLDSIMGDANKYFEDKQAKGESDKNLLYRGGPGDDPGTTDNGIRWKSERALEIRISGSGGDHVFRISVAPDGKSSTNTMATPPNGL